MALKTSLVKSCTQLKKINLNVTNIINIKELQNSFVNISRDLIIKII